MHTSELQLVELNLSITCFSVQYKVNGTQLSPYIQQILCYLASAHSPAQQILSCSVSAHSPTQQWVAQHLHTVLFSRYCVTQHQHSPTQQILSCSAYAHSPTQQIHSYSAPVYSPTQQDTELLSICTQSYTAEAMLPSICIQSCSYSVYSVSVHTPPAQKVPWYSASVHTTQSYYSADAVLLSICTQNTVLLLSRCCGTQHMYKEIVPLLIRCCFIHGSIAST